MHDVELSARAVADAWFNSGNVEKAVCHLDDVIRKVDEARIDASTAVARAREAFSESDHSFDGCPLVAPAKRGVYVSCWVWVPTP